MANTSPADSESGSNSKFYSDSSDLGSFVKTLSADFQRQCSSKEICPGSRENENATSSSTSDPNKPLKQGRKREASDSLGVNRSTLKRFCGENGEHSLPKPNQSKKANHAAVKASFNQDMIMFWFPTSSGLLELKNEVAKRLNLKGEFNIKYRDEENDLLLITCDDDLHNLPAFLASNTNTSVKLVVDSLTMSAVEQRAHNILSRTLQSLGVSWPKQNQSKKSNHANDPKRSQEVTVKATFESDIIKFQFPTSSGLLELKNEVAKKLDLKGKFNIKYKDEDNDLILITCDADLHNIPEFLASSVKLHIKLVSEDVQTSIGNGVV